MLTHSLSAQNHAYPPSLWTITTTTAPRIAGQRPTRLQIWFLLYWILSSQCIIILDCLYLVSSSQSLSRCWRNASNDTILTLLLFYALIASTRINFISFASPYFVCSWPTAICKKAYHCCGPFLIWCNASIIYRVFHRFCNIKNRHYSASRRDKLILKKVLSRS